MRLVINQVDVGGNATSVKQNQSNRIASTIKISGIMRTKLYQTIEEVKQGRIDPASAYKQLFRLLSVSNRLSPSQYKMYLKVAEGGSISTESKRQWNICHELEKKGLLRQCDHDEVVYLLNEC
jgi:hypothetical protein